MKKRASATRKDVIEDVAAAMGDGAIEEFASK
jgi:hypothetical protein